MMRLQMHALRVPVLSTMLVVGLVLGVAGTPASSGSSRSVYCSPSGDLCQGALKIRGRTYLSITLAAKYFSTYELCVKPPQGARECDRFSVKRKGSGYESRVRWSAHFEDHSKGTHRVAWYADGQKIGRGVSFRH